mmetsp:Transcript_33350/g.73478  ORF Transcript_33350/g.73478 Transcript_33350/m.73478 type:complete len:204 (-) Transcript_33350:288-899(-)
MHCAPVTHMPASSAARPFSSCSSTPSDPLSLSGVPMVLSSERCRTMCVTAITSCRYHTCCVEKPVLHIADTMPAASCCMCSALTGSTPRGKMSSFTRLCRICSMVLQSDSRCFKSRTTRAVVCTEPRVDRSTPSSLHFFISSMRIRRRACISAVASAASLHTSTNLGCCMWTSSVSRQQRPPLRENCTMSSVVLVSFRMSRSR